MMHRRPFTQSDVTRALKGAAKAGVNIARVVIESGRIIIEPKCETSATSADDLDQELAEFEARHGKN